jgi:hypothetical protein
MKQLIMFMALVLLLIVGIATQVAAENAYVLELGHTDSTITFSSITISNVNIPPVTLTQGKHTLEQRDFLGSITFKSSFTPPDYGPFTVATPYQSDTREIIVRSPSSTKLLSIPVLQFADTCGNNQCEAQESFDSCSQDCSSGSNDDYCDQRADNICDPDCNNVGDPDCKAVQQPVKPQPRRERVRAVVIEDPQESVSRSQTKPLKTSPVFIIGVVLGVIFIFFIVLLVVLSHHKGSKRQQEIKQYVQKNTAAGYTPAQIQQTLMQFGYAQEEIQKAMK